MKFCWVTVNVANMERSLDFYTGIVGLAVERMMKPNPSMEIAFLGTGETKVELIYDPKTESRSYGKDISIGFEVDSLEPLIAVLNGKGLEISGPFQPNPTIRFLYVRDPDGLQVQFVENIEP